MRFRRRPSGPQTRIPRRISATPSRPGTFFARPCPAPPRPPVGCARVPNRTRTSPTFLALRRARTVQSERARSSASASAAKSETAVRRQRPSVGGSEVPIIGGSWTCDVRSGLSRFGSSAGPGKTRAPHNNAVTGFSRGLLLFSRRDPHVRRCEEHDVSVRPRRHRRYCRRRTARVFGTPATAAPPPSQARARTRTAVAARARRHRFGWPLAAADRMSLPTADVR